MFFVALFGGQGVLAQCGQTTFATVLQGPQTDVGHTAIVLANGDILFGGYSDSFGNTGDDIVLARLDANGGNIWQRRYNAVGDDGGWSLCLAECANGDLLAVGVVNGIGLGGPEKGLIARFDAMGNVLWARHVGTSGFWEIRDIKEAMNGDILVCGSTSGIGNGQSDALVGRLSGSGSVIWFRSFGGGNQDHFTSILELSDGNIVATSHTQDPTPYNRRPWFLKLDANGNTLISKTFTATSNDVFTRSIINGDGTLLHVGFSDSFGSNSRDGLVVCTDVDGEVLWATVLSAPIAGEMMNAAQMDDQGWVVSMFPGSGFGLVKLDANGTVVWGQEIPGVEQNFSSRWADLVCHMPDDGILVAGTTNGPNEDMILTKLTACGGSTCPVDTMPIVQTFPNIVATPTIIPQSGTLAASDFTVQPITVNDILIGTQAQVVDPCAPQCQVQIQQAGLTTCLGSALLMSPTVVLGDSLDLTWSWDLGNGLWQDGAATFQQVFNAVGSQTVQVAVFAMDTLCVDTLAFTVNVQDQPQVDLGPDTLLCLGNDLTIDLTGQSPPGLLWDDGSSTLIRTIGQAGTYWASATNDCGSAVDSLEVIVSQPPVVDLGPDTVLCPGDSLVLDLGPIAGTCTWENGQGSTLHSITVSGNYWVTVDDGSCVGTDSITVAGLTQPEIQLPPDTVL